MSLLTLARRVRAALDAEERATAAHVAAEDPAVAAALAVFPEVRVVSRGPATWPPEGAWPARPPHALDPYAADAPAAACPACGANQWFRAGGGWTCGVCHPPAGVPHPDATCALGDDRDALVTLAAARGWPPVALDRVRRVVGTEAGWRTFVATADAVDLAGARAALRSPRSGVVHDDRRRSPKGE